MVHSCFVDRWSCDLTIARQRRAGCLIVTCRRQLPPRTEALCCASAFDLPLWRQFTRATCYLDFETDPKKHKHVPSVGERSAHKSRLIVLPRGARTVRRSIQRHEHVRAALSARLASKHFFVILAGVLLGVLAAAPGKNTWVDYLSLLRQPVCGAAR